MGWLGSEAARSLTSAANVLALAGTLIGVFVALEMKGHEWGAPQAVIAGGVAGWVIGKITSLGIRKALKK